VIVMTNTRSTIGNDNANYFVTTATNKNNRHGRSDYYPDLGSARSAYTIRSLPVQVNPRPKFVPTIYDEIIEE
jgi:hypothetical protein